jgi:GntR family transcriptional regulator
LLNSRRSAGQRPPKYSVIGRTLRERILGGLYVQGARLPSERMLQKEFAASRVTIRLALENLRRAGLVESRQGKGYFVRPVQALYDLGRLQGFGEIVAALGLEARSLVLAISQLPASTETAQALRLERGDRVVRIDRVRLAGERALSYDESYFPAGIGDALARLDLAHSDVFALLEGALGIELGYADLTLEIIAAEPSIGLHLGVEAGKPLVRIRRLTFDLDGRPVDFEYLYGRADGFRFRVRAARW